MKARRAQASLICDISERAVFVVAIQNVAAVGGDEQIGPAVVIVIAGGYSNAEVASCDAGFFCYIGERAVMIVVIERVAERMLAE